MATGAPPSAAIAVLNVRVSVSKMVFTDWVTVGSPAGIANDAGRFDGWKPARPATQLGDVRGLSTAASWGVVEPSPPLPPPVPPLPSVFEALPSTVRKSMVVGS